MERATVLVTGGAGYIGSHAVLALLEQGYRVVVVDDLSTGCRELVAPAATFVQGGVGDRRLIEDVLRQHRIDAVLHFAGSIVVPESVVQPLAYYRNNVAAALVLIEACVACDVTRFVFSSTAAVYGNPAELPISETAEIAPINPYGSSKAMVERILRDAAVAHGLRIAILRYFNVAGADPAGRSGQVSPQATHLIKIACEAAVGRRSGVTIYGDDYPTADGTCVRDYIHVGDLAAAHVLVLRQLESGCAELTANCGYGHGYSVREVLDAVGRAAGRPLPVTVGPRRAGDPAALVAGVEQIAALPGWAPRYDDLDTIVTQALAWERRLMAGL